MVEYRCSCSTARGPDPCYNQVGPTKAGASKSFLLTDSSGVLKIKNTWLSLLSHSLGP